MPRNYLDPPVPIVALATARGEAALALVRASGAGAIELAASCFSRPKALLAARGRSLVHGFLVDPESDEAVDEVLVSVFRAPSSPTGEDQVEISLHGSPVVSRRALEVLERAGFTPALPGEFSFRAFVNGKTDLVRAEAMNDLVRARSEGARAEALALLSGGLSRRLAAAREELLSLIAAVELRLDYGEDEVGEEVDASQIERLRQDLQALSESYAIGRVYKEGLRAVLAGPVNAGKSSLFNLFLREERSIVSPIPGTTRDYIEAEVEIGGVSVRLFDTAGLRESGDSVEAEGVARSRRVLAEADIVIYLVDASASVDFASAAGAIPAGALVVLNKIDALSTPIRELPAGWIPVSATTGEGFPALVADLEKKIHACLDGAAARLPLGEGLASGKGAAAREVHIASERQRLLLERAAGSLDLARKDAEDGALDGLAVDLREAAEALGEISGEIATPEILETIFSRFCVGK
jgi:tRNA modification GTPase